MKKCLKKLALHRESLRRLTQAETAEAAAAARLGAGTHYESICPEECKPADVEQGLAR